MLRTMGMETADPHMSTYLAATIGYLIKINGQEGTTPAFRDKITGADYRVTDQAGQARFLELDIVDSPEPYKLRIRNEDGVPIGVPIRSGFETVSDPFDYGPYAAELLEEAMQIGPCALRLATSK